MHSIILNGYHVCVFYNCLSSIKILILAKSFGMNTSIIRSQLHNYLEIADDNKVQAMYAILEEEIKESFVDYTEELKITLDERFATYTGGEAKMISEEESKKKIEQILKLKL